LVGNILKNDILAIDGVTLHDFDFIDLGKVLEPSGTVPVTIKSLEFQFWRRVDGIDSSNLRKA